MTRESFIALLMIMLFSPLPSRIIAQEEIELQIKTRTDIELSESLKKKMKENGTFYKWESDDPTICSIVSSDKTKAKIQGNKLGKTYIYYKHEYWIGTTLCSDVIYWIVNVVSIQPNPDYFIEYTIEGIPMTFYIVDNVGKDVWVMKDCIKSANGRVTIPSYPKGYRVTRICNAAFHNISGLTELVIPSTVESVEYYITLGCKNLNTITCEAPNPPEYSFTSVISDVCWGCTLYVPEGSKPLYMQANGWKDFKQINEIGVIPVPGIDINSKNFPDEEFRNYLLEQEYGKDGVITDEEINGITSISIFSDVSDLKGIEFFENLENLRIKSDKLTSLDVSKLTALYLLHLYSEKLKSYVLEDIINTLPLNVYTKRHEFVVGDEKLLSSQAIDNTRRQGWTPFYMDGMTSYKQYPGDNPTGINLKESSLDIKVGNSFIMGYTMTPSSSVRDITWDSDDSSIASVDYEGVVQGHSVGTTYINATTKNGITSRCKVTVTPTSIHNIKMDTYSDAPIFNLNGQRLDKPRKGINIIGGKKLLIK